MVYFDQTFSRLRDFFFMDPSWVRESILRLLNEQHLYIDSGVLSVPASKALYGRELGYKEKLDAFMALLEKGRIVFAIGVDTHKRYLVTSALPKQRPAFQVSNFGCVCLFCASSSEWQPKTFRLCSS